MTPERFWQRVKKTDGCWFWTGRLSKYGYVYQQGRQVGAHRVMWSLVYGPIPLGLHVCHTCDVPSCVNPAHLFLGNAAANLSDMTTKKRRAVGDHHGRRKLTADAVREIRACWLVTPQRTLAREFGVSETTISDIVRRLHWRHVNNEE